MRITIFAATGGIGRCMLEQAVAAGHDVTAVVRNPDMLTADVRVVTADLNAPDTGALTSAIDEADAVVSGLGPRRKAEFGIVSKGTQAIVDAMKAVGVRRLVVVSGVNVSTVPTPGRPNPPKHDPGSGFLMRNVNIPLSKLVLGRHFTDVALMEDLLRGSGLDWTAVRVPLLTDKPWTGVYRTARGRSIRGGFRLGRADAAHFMIRSAMRPEDIGQAVNIAY